ncbi:Uncharacterised protein (plasmid) [Tsukamurella tyrosinosolvens]|uniref:Glyoxalase-like domain-containing protein n=1 Tax=Tsukamurella tyrosinosolvens TaxID=57704 RepID=A0A1H4UVU5_TSUTY|nr:hypothetical protein [Tsukamurella tyrosinosolvens]KXO98393.1 hypothetical protein AXK58_25305 [Tsukamurella tyrosinosolvens]SEC72548.1 hypothetical protein SAMN04489793_3048 [Tsukamurella tyrosinosolvens]VEH90865.1 Uncharacterised protein [Tsukamurella tyrosinosolvens]
MQLSRITLYTPAPALQHAADAYAAMLDTEPVASSDARGDLVEVTDESGFTIELRPSLPGERPATATRLEFRGRDAAVVAERLHDQTGGVQRHLYGGSWDTVAGNSVRLIGPDEDVSPEERARVGAAIARGELEQELERLTRAPG